MSGERERRALLMRNLRSDCIHRADCSRVLPGAVNWRWAERNQDEDWKVTAPWLKACKVCDPPSPASEGSGSPEDPR